MGDVVNQETGEVIKEGKASVFLIDKMKEFQKQYARLISEYATTKDGDYDETNIAHEFLQRRLRQRN